MLCWMCHTKRWEWDSTVLATLAKVTPYTVDPTLAKTMGAWHVVQFYCYPGIHQVILEGDFSIVVLAMRRWGSYWSS